MHKNRDARAAGVLKTLAAFRDRQGWPYRFDATVDARLEEALRTDMHWVLPGLDRGGRRIMVYNARGLRDPAADVANLQRAACFLLERITTEDQTRRRGVVVVADCAGASLGMLRKLRLRDAQRGMDMVAGFPCRLRHVYDRPRGNSQTSRPRPRR